jgi:ABC-type nickel/cobalt efflux system permease component RcnA
MKTEPIARARPVLAIIIFLSCSLALSANPFMGSGVPQQARAVSPVRTSPANANLVASQATLRDALGNYFYSWKQSDSHGLFWGIIGVSFLYGILHALGPGHRKTVIFSLYLTRGAPAWEPAGTGVLLSLLHGGAAVVLLLSMRGLSGAISGRADDITNWIEGSTYLVLIAVALILAGLALKDLVSGSETKSTGAMSLGTILVTGLYPCPAQSS